MKFNEKLIELRKKEGLSQEELGYKLNVTRQTVSKWELGQTTPEMEKLVEMSKIFNISVDELINESEPTNESETTNEPKTVIEDRPIDNKNTKEKNVMIIIIGAIIIVVVLIVIKLLSGMNMFNKTTNTIEEGAEVQKNILERFFDIFDKTLEEVDKSEEKISVGNFNGPLEVFAKTGNAKPMLEEIIEINKTQDRKVTVKYNGIETQDTEAIKKIKTDIDEFGSYEVSFEYDEEGYINEAIIEKVVSQIDINKFNNPLEIYSGTKMGGQVVALCDKIITSNKTEDRKITVKYNETETQDETEIKNIKKSISTFDNYDVTFEYDADGFINKAIIEKL